MKECTGSKMYGSICCTNILNISTTSFTITCIKRGNHLANNVVTVIAQRSDVTA